MCLSISPSDISDDTLNITSELRSSVTILHRKCLESSFTFVDGKIDGINPKR